MKNTLTQDCKKKFNIPCSLHVNHPQLLKRNIYFCIYVFWSLKVKYLCKCNIFFCKNTSLLTGGSLTLKTSTGARTGIVRCPDGHRPICSAIFESSWRVSDIVRCPAGHRTVPGRAPLESYDINIKQKSSGARPMCENAGRAPSGHRTVPGRCDLTLNDPTKRRTGAVEF